MWSPLGVYRRHRTKSTLPSSSTQRCRRCRACCPEAQPDAPEQHPSPYFGTPRRTLGQLAGHQLGRRRGRHRRQLWQRRRPRRPPCVNVAARRGAGEQSTAEIQVADNVPIMARPSVSWRCSLAAPPPPRATAARPPRPQQRGASSHPGPRRACIQYGHELRGRWPQQLQDDDARDEGAGQEQRELHRPTHVHCCTRRRMLPPLPAGSG